MLQIRFVTDQRSGTTLVFPDLLTTKVLSENLDGKEATLSVDAMLSAGASALAQFPNSREIALDDVFFVLRKPEAVPVIDFQYVRTGILSARVVLVVDKSDVKETKAKIADDVSFFDPEYRGVSELHVGSVLIAKASLSDLQIERVRNTVGLVRQLNLLFELMHQAVTSADQQHVAALTELLLFEYGSIRKADGRWLLELPAGAKNIQLVELQEKRIRISGDARSLRKE